MHEPAPSRSVGLSFRVSGVRIRIPGLGIRISGLGIRISGFEIRVPNIVDINWEELGLIRGGGAAGCHNAEDARARDEPERGLAISGCGFPDSGFRIRDSDSRIRDSGCGSSGC